MAKELEITSIICFLLALIPACSRRLVIKTKRDSNRRDNSEGVKKRGKFGSSRVMTRPNLPHFFTSPLLSHRLQFRSVLRTERLQQATLFGFFFFFDGRLFSYRILCSNSWFILSSASLLDLCILEYLFLWEYCALEIDGLVLNLHITLASDPTSFLRCPHNQYHFWETHQYGTCCSCIFFDKIGWAVSKIRWSVVVKFPVSTA